MVDWGVGVILAHHGDNYKNELVVRYVQKHTLWPKYSTNNSILKVKKTQKYNARLRKPLRQ